MAGLPGIEPALLGLRDAQRDLDRAAQRLSREAPGGDLAGHMVDLLTAQRAFEANVDVIRAADSMLGTLLDTQA